MKGRAGVWRRRVGLLTVSALFLLANLGFLLGSRSIRAARRTALEQRRAELSRDVVAREAEVKKLLEQRDRLARVSSAIQDFYGRRVGSRRETLAPIVEEIHEVMKKTGVAPKSISYGTVPVKTLPLSQMSIAFGFNSDYARFKRLLGAFESNRRWIVVREVSLSRDSETPGEVQVRLVLGTYFSTDETPSLPPPASAVPPASAARRTARTIERSVRQ